MIVFAPNIFGRLMKVSENGGTPTAVTQPDSEQVTHRNPHFLPDGERFLVAQTDPTASSVPIQVVRNWSAVLAREAR